MDIGMSSTPDCCSSHALNGVLDMGLRMQHCVGVQTVRAPVVWVLLELRIASVLHWVELSLPELGAVC